MDKDEFDLCVEIVRQANDGDQYSECIKYAADELDQLRAQLAERDAELAAIKSAEPVAEYLRDRGAATGFVGWLKNQLKLESGTRLYTTPQPAPDAVADIKRLVDCIDEATQWNWFTEALKKELKAKYRL